jgi:hypothetical protein
MMLALLEHQEPLVLGDIMVHLVHQELQEYKDFLEHQEPLLRE